MLAVNIYFDLPYSSIRPNHCKKGASNFKNFLKELYKEPFVVMEPKLWYISLSIF